MDEFSLRNRRHLFLSGEGQFKVQKQWFSDENSYQILAQTFDSEKFFASAAKALQLVKTLVELLWMNLVVFLVSPFVLAACAVNYGVRLVLQFYLKLFYGEKIHLMKGADAFYGCESPSNACQFTSLYVVQGNCNLNKIRERLLNGWLNQKDSEGKYLYGRMKLKTKKMFGYNCWEVHENFNIKDHIKYLPTCSNNPDKPMSEEAIFKEIQKLCDNLIPRNKPQWEVFLVPNYRYNDTSVTKKHYAIIFSIHHSLMDGISAGQILQNGLADNKLKLAVDPLKPLRIPKWKEWLTYFMTIFFCPVVFFRAVLLNEKNCFHGHSDLCGPKKVGWSRPIQLDALRKIKNSTKTSTTAVLSSSLGGALRKLAISKDLPVPSVIHAVTAVAILPYPNIKPQNRFSCFLVPIECGIESAGERLQVFYEAIQDTTLAAQAMAAYYTIKLAGWFPEIVYHIFYRITHGTVLLSNVPGPVEAALLFGGDPLVDAVAWSPAKNKVGISLCLFSYNGKVRAAVMADDTVFPDSSDVTVLLSEFEQEIQTLGKLSGLREEDCFFNNNNRQIQPRTKFRK